MSIVKPSVGHTKHDLPMNLWGSKVTIPKGTRVHRAVGGWVVSSVALLVELTNNSHDPAYRYAFVDEKDIEIQPFKKEA